MHPTRIFKTPEDLYEKFKEYKEELEEKARQWERIQYVGKDGKKVIDFPKLPISLEGFYRFCWDNELGNIEQYFRNKDKYYSDFVAVCSRVRNEIREDQITGGLLGFYNPSITQRLNNLKETVETNTSANVKLMNIDVLNDTTNNGAKENSEQ